MNINKMSVYNLGQQSRTYRSQGNRGVLFVLFLRLGCYNEC